MPQVCTGVHVKQSLEGLGLSQTVHAGTCPPAAGLQEPGGVQEDGHGDAFFMRSPVSCAPGGVCPCGI